MKFNTWPGVTWKYSGTFAGINAAEVTRDNFALRSGTATARPVSELRDLGRARRLTPGRAVRSADHNCERTGPASSRSDNHACSATQAPRGLLRSRLCRGLAACSPMGLIGSTCTGARPATSTASIRERSQPTCLCRRRSISFPCPQDRQRVGPRRAGASPADRRRGY
jgi:hypothetical protein